MKKNIFIFLLLSLVLVANFAFAQPDPFGGAAPLSDTTENLPELVDVPIMTRCDAIRALGINSLQDLINSSGCVVSQAITLTVPLAILFFLWGLMRFVMNAGSEEAKESGKRIMIWGVVALFIMVSIWGIIELIQSNLGVEALSFPN